jgi:hypothetical protein
MLVERSIFKISLREWLQGDTEMRNLIRFCTALILIQFIVFKIMYPLPNFMPPDSYSYIDAARQNLTINTWAIGYSKFLRLISSLTTSSNFLVWVQYLLLEASILYLLFTFRYFMNLNKWWFRLILFLSILNPLIPHISNFISSDALFTSLSLIWFTQLIWVLAKPTQWLIIFHAIVLSIVFTIRFNALYYPLISILVILQSRVKIYSKLVGIMLIVIFISGFVGRSTFEYLEQTRTFQYSSFGGWQLAANALYGYAYSSLDSSQTVPQEFRGLQEVVNLHMDSIRHLPLSKRPDKDVAIYYLWDINSPLIVYLNKRWGKDTTTPYFQKWVSMAPLYASYGGYTIIHHPIPFIKHYIWPNFIKFYAPPTGFMSHYSSGNQYVEPVVSRWFRWKDNKVYNRFQDPNIEIVRIFPCLYAILNIIFLSSLIILLGLRIFQKENKSAKIIFRLAAFVWLIQLLFSVFAAPIELRYQLFSLISTFPCAMAFVAFIFREIRINSSKISNSDPYQGKNFKIGNLL